MELIDGIRGMWRYLGSGPDGCGRFEAIKEPKKIPCAPYVQTDTMLDPVEHPVTGKLYDSKSALRRTYKELGLIERGNEKPKVRQAKGADFDEIREEVKEATRKLKWGMAPLTEREKWLLEKEKRETEDYRKRNQGTMWLTEGEDQIGEKFKIKA